MVSTVTSSTVSIVTSAAIAGSVALIGILALLALLIQKELVGAAPGGRYKKLNLALNIGILPLLIAFVLIVATRVADILK